MSLIRMITVLGLMFGFSSAIAEPVSNVNVGVNYYSGSDGTTTTKLSNPGYNIMFLTGDGGKWLRSAYGASLEIGSGTNASLLVGSLLFGGEVSPKNANKLTPFVGVYLNAGWANYSVVNTSSSNGLLYGGVLAGGAQFKIGSTNSNTAIRLQTSYRYLLGSVGAVSGSDLSAISFSLGLVF